MEISWNFVSPKKWEPCYFLDEDYCSLEVVLLFPDIMYLFYLLQKILVIFGYDTNGSGSSCSKKHIHFEVMKKLQEITGVQ